MAAQAAADEDEEDEDEDQDEDAPQDYLAVAAPRPSMTLSGLQFSSLPLTAVTQQCLTQSFGFTMMTDVQVSLHARIVLPVCVEDVPCHSTVIRSAFFF